MQQLLLKKEDGTQVLMITLESANLLQLIKGSPAYMRIGDFFPNGLIPSNLEIQILYSENPVASAREIAKEANMVFDERTARAEKVVPHCPQCYTTVEQLGIMGSNTPLATVCCSSCGAVFGVLPSSSLVSPKA